MISPMSAKECISLAEGERVLLSKKSKPADAIWWAVTGSNHPELNEFPFPSYG